MSRRKIVAAKAWKMNLSIRENHIREIEEDRETWLDRVNLHLEKLLKRANRDNQIIRHMAYHYRT